MASITVGIICISWGIPQPIFCALKKESFHSKSFVNNLLTQVNGANTTDVLVEFENLNNAIDPIKEGKKFLNAFLKEINLRYGLNLTINDACQLVRENLHVLDMSVEMEQVVLGTIELYESNKPTNIQCQKIKCAAMIAIGIACPLDWNFVDLIKKQYKNSVSKSETGPDCFFNSPACQDATGIRVSELCALNIKDIDLKSL